MTDLAGDEHLRSRADVPRDDERAEEAQSQNLPRVLLSRYFDDDNEEEISRVYLALLREPEPTRDRIIAHGIPPDAVDRAAGVLHWRGMVDISNPERWVVAAPDIAMRAYASAIERQARRARATADDMALIYQQTRDQARAGPPEPVRVLSSIADLDGAMSQVLARARHRVDLMRAVPADPDHLVALINLRQSALSHAGVSEIEVSAVYDSVTLELPDALSALRARSAEGEDIRLAPALPFSAIVVDSSFAVLDFRNIDATGRGSYLVESGPIVPAVRSLIHRVHEDAVPLPTPGRDLGGHPALSERDEVVLALLAAGATDSTITRQLGVSRRTVERRVQHLMAHLGATTRFQAGVEAGRRGLV
jgi:DNA-binding CsgD family transcriptional regulator